MAFQNYQLELVYGCNLTCFYCTTSDKLQLMPESKAIEILDSLQPTKYLFLQGHGEPTLHPSLIMLAKYAKSLKKFTYVCTITNGIIEIDYSVFDKVFFSCDDIKPIKSGKYLDRIKDNFYKAYKVCREVQIWTVDFGQDLNPLVQLCKDLKIRQHLQRLDTNATLAYKYDITKPKLDGESFECTYVKKGLLRRFLVDGTPVDCCWCRLEHKELFKDIDLLHNNLRKGIVIGPCVDCMHLGAIK